MSFFSEERANELRNIFFESAQELLQSLNDEGLALEKEPTNPETIRNIRRIMHTLKGDSAACGYKELSELAHLLEDALVPEIAKLAGAQLAEVVLASADTFDGMLAAYRGDLQPPAADSLREMISAVTNPNSAKKSVFAPRFDWTEYERLLIQQHSIGGQQIYSVGLQIDPQCPMRIAALQLIRNVMQEVGTILVMRPDENATEVPDAVEAVLATQHQQEWIEKKCNVPPVVSKIVVKVYSAAASSESAVRTTEAQENSVLPAVTEPAQSTVVEASSTSAAPENNLAPAPVSDGNGRERKPNAAPVNHSENVLRVEAERIDSVLDLVGELIISKSMLVDAIGEFTRTHPKDPLRNNFIDAMSFQSQVLGKLQRSVMKIRMVPVEQLFRRFPRVVRDVAKFENKDIQLLIEGETTDLDKSILDALAEPLTHLVRNAASHGIEKGSERAAAGKPEAGTIKLNAYHQGNQVIIEVSDDGRGLDRERIVTKALEKGVVTREELARMTDGETLNLIFQAGFSTAEKVTEVSGRGVGMDVVKSVIERLKGQITIHTEAGRGTTFQLRLPLTLAIIKALLFKVHKRLYAVPLGSVNEIARAYESDVHLVDGNEVMQLRDQLLTLVRLRNLVDEESAPNEKQKLFIVVVSLGHRKFGLIVDRLAGEQELVIKALDDDVLSTELVSGASVLGDGRVVLILNIASVIERVGKLTTGYKVGASA